MRGTDSSTGKPLSGIAHLKQSIRDILTTRIGSRVARRTYGSELFDLIDAPLNDATKMDLMVAAEEALRKWEPRIFPQKFKVERITPGHITIAITGLYLPDGRLVTIDGISIS